MLNETTDVTTEVVYNQLSPTKKLPEVETPVEKDYVHFNTHVALDKETIKFISVLNSAQYEIDFVYALHFTVKY